MPGSNTGDEHLYYCQDANYNVTALVEDYDGEVVERYMYSPYGEVSVLHGVRDSSGTDTSPDEWSERTSNTFENALLYCGYRFDNETGLYCVRHRYYEPPLGRWLTRDPKGYTDRLTLYAYVHSNPLTGRDPSGLWDDPRAMQGIQWTEEPTPGALYEWQQERLKREAAARRQIQEILWVKDLVFGGCKKSMEAARGLGLLDWSSTCTPARVAAGYYKGVSRSVTGEAVAKVGGAVGAGFETVLLCKPCKLCCYFYIKGKILVGVNFGLSGSIGMVSGDGVYKPEDYAGPLAGITGEAGLGVGAEGGKVISLTSDASGTYASGSVVEVGAAVGIEGSSYWLIECEDAM